MRSSDLGAIIALAFLVGSTASCSGDSGSDDYGLPDAGSGNSGANDAGSSNNNGGNGSGNHTGNNGGNGSGNHTGNNGGSSNHGGSNGNGGSGNDTNNGGSGNDTNNGGSGSVDNPLTDPEDGPPAGNADGHYPVPAEAGLADTSNPDHVVGTGTPESCTADDFIAAVAEGGITTFNCGAEPVTITLDRPAKVFNDKGPDIVIDGKGLVTLSGGGSTRILYMNTCDPDLVWTTDHCDNQDTPRLTVQNITFVDGNSKSAPADFDGGGAIWVRGGRFKVINSRFFNNVCADVGPDVGGGGIRVLTQYNGLPVYVVNSTFGGAEGFGNVCSNGGGISSIHVSWSIYNSLFSYNKAIGNGGNPAMNGPGGGSGGAIYNDGLTMTLSLYGTRIEHNEVNTHGSAIFFVTNDHSGDIHIEDSTITNNTGGSWYETYPQISNHADTPITVVDSMIE